MIAEIHRRSALLAGAEVVGVMDATPADSASLAQRWGVREAFSSIEDVVASDVDVVHVCTPNVTHAAYATAALKAGKHVICEKPLGISVEEAQTLVDLAKEMEVVAAIPFVYRYHPMVRELRARRIAGEFGPWNLLHGSYAQDWLLSPLSSNWRVHSKDGGASRAFADIGSHWCDLVEWVTGESIQAVTAQLSIAIPQRPATSGRSFSTDVDGSPLVTVTTEDIATVMLRTSNGVPGSVTITQVAAGRKNRLWFEVDGAKASAVFDQENPETLWLGYQDGARQLVRDPGVGSPEQRRLSHLPAGHVQGWARCFEDFVTDVYAAIAGDMPDGLPTFEDGARSARLVDAVLLSAASSQWTEVQQ